MRVDWQVKVWTDRGETDWSRPAWFETGLLEPSDWVAKWIAPVERSPVPPGKRPAQLLRTAFQSPGPVPTARLYATAHGIYEMFINGRRVGDRELTPGFTSYLSNLHVQVYDVSELLQPGDNEWQVVLSDGWFRGRCRHWYSWDLYGDRLAFLGQLRAGDTVVISDDGWSCSTGPILAADLMQGQVEDHRVEPSAWHPVAVVDHGFSRLGYSPAPPTRRIEEVRPVGVRRISSERQVVDLGQNINGWTRLTRLGPAGAAIKLVHGEALDPEGDVTIEHIFLPVPPQLARTKSGNLDDTSAAASSAQTDTVVSVGREEDVFEPRHTTHGFQYVRVEGHPDRLTPGDITGIAVHTDLRRTGWFRCSDERVNRFHQNAVWSFRDNACEIPTDCPTRERSGWTGDWQLFLHSAAFLYDVAGFSVKWLRDLVADQLPDGRVTNIAPEPERERGVADPQSIWNYMQGSGGWGDAMVIVPWALYQLYGDTDILSELWPNMLGWVRYAAKSARTKRFPARAEARPDPAPHEQYLWDGGFHWGEWTEPDHRDTKFWEIDQGHVATAYLRHSASLLARIGRLLGHADEAERLETLAMNARLAWQAEYVGDDGRLTPDTQANHVRALAFDLVPDGLRAKTADRLVDLIRAGGTHLGTGFLATPHLLPVLADSGRLDVAYDLLLQQTSPSWLAMVDRGATTVWEDWEGISSDGSVHDSLNHYSKGAVISFLHRYVAGIQPLDAEPAYRRFRVEPRPGGGLGWADAVFDSPYGRIESSWRRGGNQLRLTITVPAGTSAQVKLPSAPPVEQVPGTRSYRSELPDH
jgi:alpha-L-rhamnosidase